MVDCFLKRFASLLALLQWFETIARVQTAASVEVLAGS
jgi:hypothetical protein